MGVKYIADEVGIVPVPKPEYEELVRDSETLDIIKTLMKKSNYVSTGDLKIILGIEESEGKKSESV